MIEQSGMFLTLVTVSGGIPNRQTFAPGDSLAGKPQELIDAAAALWTAEAVAEWQEGRPAVPTAEEALAAERAQMQCSRMQARLALHAAGLLATVEAAVAAADVPVQIAWADAVIFQRMSPTIAALQGAVGLTDAQVDELFRTAATLSA
jgi:hypothetical protein